MSDHAGAAAQLGDSEPAGGTHSLQSRWQHWLAPWHTRARARARARPHPPCPPRVHPRPPTHTHTHPHTHTQAQTHRHTHTQAHTLAHTVTGTHRDTGTATGTRTHARTRVRARARTHTGTHAPDFGLGRYRPAPSQRARAGGPPAPRARRLGTPTQSRDSGSESVILGLPRSLGRFRVLDIRLPVRTDSESLRFKLPTCQAQCQSRWPQAHWQATAPGTASGTQAGIPGPGPGHPASPSLRPGPPAPASRADSANLKVRPRSTVPTSCQCSWCLLA